MRILITAGATWAKIDAVRILTNRFTGASGLYLYRALKKKGHRITLLVNPHCLGELRGPDFIIFRYYNELIRSLRRLLEENHYDAIIHMASVSDYCLRKASTTKIPSGKKSFSLPLVATKKVTPLIRRLAKDSLLIQFKLENSSTGIIKKAYRSLIENKSDYCVTNTITFSQNKRTYRIVALDGSVSESMQLKSLATTLNQLISDF